MTHASVTTLLALVVLAGCAHTTAFGPEEQGHLMLARGEADYNVGEGARGAVGWREAFCDAEEAAETALRESVDNELTHAWAMAALRTGNRLPVLTDSSRARMVENIMGNARLVSSGEPRPGLAESYMGVRLSGDLGRCVAEVRGRRVGDHCSRVPEHSSPLDCQARAEPPERLYYLESSERE